jgi:hypothetical protein
MRGSDGFLPRNKRNLRNNTEVPSDKEVPGPNDADPELSTVGNGLISTRGSGSSASSGLTGVTSHD